MKKIRFGNIVWGLSFVAAAGMIVLNIMGLMGELNIWTMLISIPVVVSIIFCAAKTEWAGMFLLLALLTLLYRGNIERAFGIEINFWALLGIAVLLSIGFYILFGRRKGAQIFNWSSKYTGDYETIKNISGEKLYFKERFTGASKYISSENLSYVSIKNSFGGMEIYFEGATLSPDGAVVDIDNGFGGLEIYIPRGWNIVNQINNFAGGVDIPTTSSYIKGAPTITFRGRNSFGGIDILLI